MRKQYHFRPSNSGFYAWDISKLIEKTKQLAEINVGLHEIKELDENWWYQGEEDIPSCRSITEHVKIIKDADLAYPIILSSDGRLMDGMHRICKALLLGMETIRAVQFEEDPIPDYQDIHPDDLPYD